MQSGHAIDFAIYTLSRV